MSMLKAAFRFVWGAYADALRLARRPRAGLKSLYGVSLYRNAGYLMAQQTQGTRPLIGKPSLV